MQLLLYIYIYIFLKQRQVFLESQHVNWVSRGSLFADSLTRLTVELELPSLVEAGWGRGLWSQQAGCESRPCLWVLMWLWDKFLSVSGLTSPWIKGTMTGLTGSGAAGAGWGWLGAAASRSVRGAQRGSESYPPALSLHADEASRALGCLFLGALGAPLNACYTCLWPQQPGVNWSHLMLCLEPCCTGSSKPCKKRLLGGCSGGSREMTFVLTLKWVLVGGLWMKVVENFWDSCFPSTTAYEE